MKVLIDKEVVAKIDDFYTAAMSNHISLSEETVSAKKQRLIAALRSLVDYHFGRRTESCRQAGSACSCPCSETGSRSETRGSRPGEDAFAG